MAEPELQLSQVAASEVDDSLLKECATLFSNHYGFWAKECRVPRHGGDRIQLSHSRLRGYLTGDSAWVATARRPSGELIGYAMAVHYPHRYGRISWVTQLVVHADFRHKLVASLMLNSIWGFSDDFAWGISSANPYAVRALEKATRRRCNPKIINESLVAVKKAISNISYLSSAEISLTSEQSIINTDFNQNITRVEELIKNVSSKYPWALGRIKQGEE